MRKLILFLSISYFLPLSAQRYTGYGRGVDWNDVYGWNWIDSSFLLLVIIILLLGLIFIGIDKTRQYLCFSKQGFVPFIIFKGLKKFDITTVISNEDGEIEELCVFTNILGNKTFVAFSPYLREVPLKEIIQNKKDFYITWEKRGCYFLCTKETERYKKDCNNEYPYCVYEDDLEYILSQLNIEHNLHKFTFE